MNRRQLLASCTPTVFGAAVLRRAFARTLNDFDLRGALIPVKALEQGGPLCDGFPSIDRPRFLAAAESGLKDADRVLAQARNGVAHAYLMHILN